MLRLLVLIGLLAALPAAARDCPGASCLLGDFGCLEAQRRCAVESPDGVRTGVDSGQRRPAANQLASKCEELYGSCLASCPSCGHDCAKSREKCELE